MLHSMLCCTRLKPDVLLLYSQEEYVDDLLKRLGLGKSADTIVGDAKTRGISGHQPLPTALPVHLPAPRDPAYARGGVGIAL